MIFQSTHIELPHLSMIFQSTHIEFPPILDDFPSIFYLKSSIKAPFQCVFPCFPVIFSGNPGFFSGFRCPPTLEVEEPSLVVMLWGQRGARCARADGTKKDSFFWRNVWYIYIYIWVNYNDLTTTSLGIMVSKGNHPKMALIQVSEIL